MVMRVDHEAYRQVGDSSYSCKQIRRRRRILEGVDHHYAVFADYESRVATGLPFIIDNGGPYTVADLLQLEIVRSRARACCDSEQEERNPTVCHHDRLSCFSYGIRTE